MTENKLTPQTLHDWYRMNVLDVRSAPEWERRWMQYIAQGYTLEDLALLVKYLRREIKHERRNQGALLLRNLLDLGPDYTFLRLDEDLALAKAAFHAVPVKRPVTIPKAPPPATQAQLADFARRLREQAAQIGVAMRPDINH